MRDLREACRTIAARAAAVHVEGQAVAGYAAGLGLGLGLERQRIERQRIERQRIELERRRQSPPGEEPEEGRRESLAAFWLTLDAINFGSGWFPTLRKRAGHSGYGTVAAGLHERFEHHGPWSAAQLAEIDSSAIAEVLGQRPDHELMALFARSLTDLGTQVQTRHQGSFAAVVDAAGGSAVALAQRLGGWSCFADSSHYRELLVPFLKRAQIAAADIERAGVARFDDLGRLTMFADNLVPHVLRLDGILSFDAELVARIDRGELIEHDSPEEVEIRACALHAVELIVAQQPGVRAAEVDQLLWERGQLAGYKASPRHRSRCTAY